MKQHQPLRRKNMDNLIFDILYEHRKDIKAQVKALVQLLAQQDRQSRIDELELLIKDAAPLIPKESWEDWSWRVQKHLKTRLTELQTNKEQEGSDKNG